MKIDFHVHGSLSSKLGFDPEFFQNMITHARSIGLDGIALTDHFHGKDYLSTHLFLDGEFPYINDYYDIQGIRIFPGIEVDVKEGLHLLAIGDRDSVREYHHRFEGHFTPETFCTTQDFFKYQDGLNLLSIIAHPYRPGREIYQLDPRYYPLFQAVDLNARDIYFFDAEIHKKTESFSREFSIPMVAGSDTHHYYQLGSAFNEFQTDLNTINEIRSQIALGTYCVFVDENLKMKVSQAREIKQAIKSTRLGNG